MTFVHAANAIAFEVKVWRADNSPFDQYLRGEDYALTLAQKRGKILFYRENKGCHRCHSGVFQTDQVFHAIGMPQIGPGKGDGFDGHEDFGRERVTGDANDRYGFRTPSLRNVALTGPWGHDGAFNTLRAVVEHHLNPEKSIFNYEHRQAVLPGRPDLNDIAFRVQNDSGRLYNITAANELQAKPLRKKQVDYLLAFLHALTDTGSLNLRNDVPKSVPSNLPLGD